ncbi:MAG: hypothetical protein GVY24_05070 [Planctomycetes bacterium]|jgi:hypothetical protein|nr:hypothetical protein [Planctomycetota bacterium]
MSDQFVVFIGDGQWWVGARREESAQVLPVIAAADAPLDERVDQVKVVLAEQGYADRPVALAIDSPWCLSARIGTEDIERGGRRQQALAFGLEQYLPISAEDFVADYYDISSSEALGVCCEEQRLRAIIDAFQAAGLRVRHILPGALLAAAHVAERYPESDMVLLGESRPNADAAPSPTAEHAAPDTAAVPTEPEADAAVAPVASTPGSFDLVELRKGKPVRWWWLADDCDAVREYVRASASSNGHPARLVVVGADPTDGATWEPGQVERVPLSEVCRHEAATQRAAAILEEVAQPWIDLRTGPLAAPERFELYRKHATALFVAAVCLLAAVIGITQYRAAEYEDLTDQYRARQAGVFREALPGQGVPGPLRLKMRLRSERRNYAALAGRHAGDDKGDAFELPESALMHLTRLLDRLPDDLRFRILELSIEPDLIRIDGQARKYKDAERIATRLRQAGGYEVEPPRTESLRDKGVSFVFTARPEMPNRQEGG